MRYLLLVFSLILLAVGASAQIPIGYQQWQIGDQTKTQFGGAPANYQTDEGWAAIVNNFVVEGDSIFACEQSILKTRVNRNDGTSTVTLTEGGIDYTITQKLLGVGWINTDTRQSLWIDSTMNFNLVSRNGNIVKWTGISPGVDYRVSKDNGGVHHGIFFKPVFIDSAIVLYNQRADSLDISLANVIVYTFSANINHHDSVFGDVDMRFFRDFGRMSYQSTRQQLHFPGMDTLPPIPVRQYWEKRGNKLICLEYVMMRRIKQVHEAYPTTTLWHNASQVFQNSADVEDASVNVFSPDNNYGSADGLIADDDNNRILVRLLNLASNLGAGQQVDSCILSAYNFNTFATNMSLYRVLKPWVEGDENGTDNDDGDVTWNDWASDASEWGTAGVNNASDAGDDNTGDGTDYDRLATAEETVVIANNEDDQYHHYYITSLAQQWYAETADENGVVFIGSAGGDYSIRSSDFFDPDRQLYFTVYYSAVGAPSELKARRRRLLIKGI